MIKYYIQSFRIHSHIACYLANPMIYVVSNYTASLLKELNCKHEERSQS